MGILSCPFCGGRPSELNDGKSFWVQCIHCGAQSGAHSTPTDALKAWENREDDKYDEED